MLGFDNLESQIIEVTLILIDINSYYKDSVFLYITLKIAKYDIILRIL